jgi:hypothetical protein
MFRDFSYARQVQQYQGLPIDEVEALGDKLETRFVGSKTAQNTFEMGIDNLEVRDINRGVIDDALATAQGRLKGIRENNNWEDAEFLVQDAQKEFGMNKDVRGAMKDKAAYDAWSKSLEERYLTGQINPEVYNKTKKLASIKNQNPVTYDAQTGEYKNIFSGYTPMNNQDVQKAMFEMGEKWKSNTNPAGIEIQTKDPVTGNVVSQRVKWDNSMQGYLIVGTEKYLREEELQAGLTQAVMANPMYRSFIQEGLMLDKAIKYGDTPDVKVTDLFSTNPADGALLSGTTEAEAMKMIEELGYDPNEVLADPAVREALYDQISMMKKVKSYVDPAASAYSFSETEHQYLTDVVLMESIKHANTLRAQQQQHSYDMAKQRDAQAFTLKTTATPIHIANPSVISLGEDFDINKTKESLTENKGALAKLKKQLETQKSSNPKGSYAAITKQITELQNVVSQQEGFISGVKNGFLDAPETLGRVDKTWAIYQKRPGFGSNGIKTKEQFIEFLKGNTPLQTLTGKGGTKLTMGVTPLNDDALFLNSHQRKFDYDAQEYAKVNDMPGIFGNILWGDKDSAEYKVSTEVLTPFVLKNATNYTIAGGSDLTAYLNKLAGHSASADYEHTVTMSDGDQMGGSFPQYITTVNKKTGARISQQPIYSKSGGADIRYDTGIAIRQQSKPGSPAYLRGGYMAASSTFMNWNPLNVAKELATVNDNDVEGVYDFSEPIEVPGPNGPLVIQVKKSRMPAYNYNGSKVGVNTRFQVYQVDPDTGELKPQTVGNPQFAQEQAAIVTTIQSPEYKKMAPVEKQYLINQYNYYNSFANQQDAQVALFDMAYPDAGSARKEVVGYSQSSTNTQVNKTSTPTKAK